MKKREMMFGQLALEFLVIVAVYLAFLFVIINSEIEIFDGLKKSSEIVSYSTGSQRLAIIYSSKIINIPSSIYRIDEKGCSILLPYVRCGRIDEYSKTKIYTISGEENEQM